MTQIQARIIRSVSSSKSAAYCSKCNKSPSGWFLIEDRRGPVTDRAALVFHREVILTVRDRVRKAIQEGKTLDQVHDAKLTADYESRVGGFPAFINVFLDALYKELKTATGR